MRYFLTLLREDFERYLDGHAMGARSACRAIVNNPGLQAVVVYRFGRALLSRRRYAWWWPFLAVAAPLYAVSAWIVRSLYGIRLYLSAQIGAGFSVLHFGGIEFANCRVGEQCSVGNQVKVGSTQDAQGPQIGDRVWIGAHAKVTSPVTIGDGATIAPGARVTRNVPTRSLVVGNPARIVSRSYDNSSITPKG